MIVLYVDRNFEKCEILTQPNIKCTYYYMLCLHKPKHCKRKQTAWVLVKTNNWFFWFNFRKIITVWFSLMLMISLLFFLKNRFASFPFVSIIFSALSHYQVMIRTLFEIKTLTCVLGTKQTFKVFHTHNRNSEEDFVFI